MKKMILICICIAGIIWSMFQIGWADDMDVSHEIPMQDTTWKPTEEDIIHTLNRKTEIKYKILLIKQKIVFMAYLKEMSVVELFMTTILE